MGKEISGWGNYPKRESEILYFNKSCELDSILRENPVLTPQGNRRSYGDSALGDHVLSTLKFNKFLGFDRDRGTLKCQSGVMLSEILEVIVPQGWFLPVTPGTKFITVGGAIASDIHGKNHHKDGSFSNFLIRMSILCGDGKIYECSKTENPDLFEATCGGMGLTGIIIDAEFSLKPVETAYINQLQIKAKNLEEAVDLFIRHENYTYSVAWIDCLKGGKNLGRSILMLGEHAKKEELGKGIRNPLQIHRDSRLNVPFNFPSFTLNSFTVKAFNQLYYSKNLKKESRNILHYNPYFYPLDNVLNWNRIYGVKGFLQYQMVLPMESKEGLVKIVESISSSKIGSFLAVLKVFGEQDGMMAFPKRGYTLALDFPIRKKLFPLLDKLDKIVVENNGRIYLTKDARMDKETMKTYPRMNEFLDIVRKYNPDQNFRSDQSKRLSIGL